MIVYACILNQAKTNLWGLDARTRLLKQLKKLNITRILDQVREVPSESRVLLLRGDYLYEDRILHGLVNSLGSGSLLALKKGSDLVPVAAFVSSDEVRQARRVLRGEAEIKSLSNLRTVTPEDMAELGFQQKLRKIDLPYVLPIKKDYKKILEDHLFSGSYKGITDLVTKWVWPSLAKRAVHFCVRHSITPNQVTLLSLVLVVLVTVLFSYGLFIPGLILGWFMTFLDTVDGKLARVTLNSSKFGNVFDHGLDLIHPPIWYIAWGLGLSAEIVGSGLGVALWLIVLGYIGGRLAELGFKLWAGRFGIFCWRPFDSYFRLITARRNPNLIILTIGALLGFPYLALIGVVFWTVFTTLVLFVRLYQAVEFKKKHGYTSSWLTEANEYLNQSPMAVKIFSSTASKDLMKRL